MTGNPVHFILDATGLREVSGPDPRLVIDPEDPKTGRFYREDGSVESVWAISKFDNLGSKKQEPSQ